MERASWQLPLDLLLAKWLISRILALTNINRKYVDYLRAKEWMAQDPLP